MLRPLDVWIRQEQWDLQSVPTTGSSIFAGASRPVLGSLFIESSGCHGRSQLTAGWGAAPFGPLDPWTRGRLRARDVTHLLRGADVCLVLFRTSQSYGNQVHNSLQPDGSLTVSSCLGVPRSPIRLAIGCFRWRGCNISPKGICYNTLHAEGSGGAGAEFRRLALGLSALVLFRPVRVFGRIPFFG